MSPTVVLVTGGRTYGCMKHGTVQQRQHIWETMNQIKAYYGDIIVVHGGAGGVDTYVEVWAEAMSVHAARVRALWNKLGNSAGPRRNSAMLWLRPDICVVFPGGDGTADMARKARAANIPTWEV